MLGASHGVSTLLQVQPQSCQPSPSPPTPPALPAALTSPAADRGRGVQGVKCLHWAPEDFTAGAERWSMASALSRSELAFTLAAQFPFAILAREEGVGAWGSSGESPGREVAWVAAGTVPSQIPQGGEQRRGSSGHLWQPRSTPNN